MSACVFCGNPATLLCDFVLGFEIMGWTKCTGQAALNADRFEEYVPGKGLPYTKTGGECFTCDAPMCSECSKYDGAIFMDGDKKHTGIDSVDKCPLHWQSVSKSPVITAETAEKIRRQLWNRPMLRIAVEGR